MKIFKTLIVGGAGYAGGHLVDLLQSDNKYDVTVYDNLLYEQSFYKKVEFIRGDVRDVTLVLPNLNEYDVVIWLAAIVGDGACEVNPKITNEVNKDAFFKLVDCYGGKIIYTSTCSVYGAGEEFFSEESEPNPLSLYAKTKLESERYLSDKHVDYLVFRLGTLYGVGDEFSRVRLDLAVNALTYRACTDKPLRVFSGEQWRPMTHVKDAAKAIKFGIDRDMNGLYNLVAENCQIKDIAEEVKKLIPSTKIIFEDTPFEDLRNYKATKGKYPKNGFRFDYSLSDGILDIKKIFDSGRLKDPENPVYYNVDYLKYLYEQGKFLDER